MAVYVDPLIDYGWKLGASCHLTADTLEELHVMAEKIGMKRSWFQLGKNDIPHYDLVGSKRKLAVEFGAIELTRNAMAERVMKFINEKANDFCTCPDFGYYMINDSVICSRCNRSKPKEYVPNPHLYEPIPLTETKEALAKTNTNDSDVEQ